MTDTLKITFNSQHRIAICRPVGPLTAQHTQQLLDFLLGFEETHLKPFNRLLDLTQVTEISLSSADIRAYALARWEATADLPAFRTAIIAPGSTMTVGLLYASLMEGSKIRVSTFANTSSAVADWLGVPEEIVQSEPAHHK